MNTTLRASLAACLLATAAYPAHAAQSYDNCAGYVDTLPATISTPGTWCLRKDLSTAIASGAAITIAANDVVLDCNHFKLGGLAAGPSTLASGVFSNFASYVTVRRCNVRGFEKGIWMKQGEGLRVEDNRLEANTRLGITIASFNGLVARNLVRDTGGATSKPGEATAIAVVYSTDVVDNTVVGVAPLANASGVGKAYGIYAMDADGTRVAGNRVRGLAGQGQDGAATAVQGYQVKSLRVEDNELSGSGDHVAVQCIVGNPARLRGNIINGFSTAISGCVDAGNNDMHD